MDLRRLNYFLAVAEHGGFSPAARALHVSQPALSLAVKELEQELKTPLFERLGRSVVLTPAGEALLGPATQTRRDVDTARAAVEAVRGLAAGSLALCCLPTLAADPVAALIGQFRQLHPAVRIDLAAPDDSADLVRSVRHGESELAVTSARDAVEDLVAVGIGRQELLVVLPAEWGSGSGSESRSGSGSGCSGTGVNDTIALSELSGVPLITTPVGTSTRMLLEEGFSEAGVVPDVAVVTAQRDAVLPLVAAGAGAALVPEPLAAMASFLGAQVRRPVPAITRTVVLLHRSGLLAPAAQRFVELATAVL